MSISSYYYRGIDFSVIREKYKFLLVLARELQLAHGGVLSLNRMLNFGHNPKIVNGEKRLGRHVLKKGLGV